MRSRRILLLEILFVLIGAVDITAQNLPKLDDFHWLVDANANDFRPFVYKSFQELDSAIEQKNPDSLTVYIMPWVYWIDNPNDTTIRRGNPPIGMTINCNKLTMIGVGNDPAETVLACQRGQSQGAEGNFTMFDFQCNRLVVRNLTFGDYLNVDLEYPLNSKLSRKKKSATITQGQIAFMSGQKLIAENCRFISRLNLCPIINAATSIYRNCHFESTDDALNGNATYESCDFDFYGSRPLYTTSGNGAIFNKCTFNIHHGGPQYFTKQPGRVVVLDCEFNCNDNTYIGWTPVVPRWLRCLQTGNTINGKPLFIDSLNPEATALNGAKAYKAVDAQFDIIPHEATVTAGVDSLCLKVKTNKAESLNQLNWQIEKGFEDYAHFISTTTESCTIVPFNDTNDAKKFLVNVFSDDSLMQAACEVTVNPSQLPTPKFTKQPKVRIHKGTAMVDYSLDLRGCRDESDIKWFRINESKGAGEAVATQVAGSNNGAQRKYRLRSSDEGCRIEALVTPKSNRSVLAQTSEASPAMSRRIVNNDISQPYIIETDFSDLPELTPFASPDNWSAYRYKPADTKAYEWNQDNPKKLSKPWYYGHGTNGCRDSIGLLQNIQGARLVYTPKRRDYGNMSIELDVTPAKTAGQGFSSNRMQYMDICLKYDNAAMNGYGLRIIRTLKHGNAVDFQLVSFREGKAIAITEAISSTCYRGNCNIHISYHNGNLSASATTDLPSTDPQLPNSVSLVAKVEPNNYGDFVVQHTGTTGEGQTMLRHLRISYD